MIVLDFTERRAGSTNSSSGYIAWRMINELRDEGEYPEAVRYRRYLSGMTDTYCSNLILTRMNECINLPNRLCAAWRARIVARLLEL